VSRIIRSSSSSIEKLKELHPQDDLKAADSRLYRHELYYFGLYYIICFPVKENLWIMRWVSVLDVLVFKATHRPFKRRTHLEGYMGIIISTATVSNPLPIPGYTLSRSLIIKNILHTTLSAER